MTGRKHARTIHLGERLDHLDGLRGVAAVSVVVFHAMSAFTPWLVPEQEDAATAAIAYSPLAVLWNGTFAVSVFFVLSGFVVTNATLRKADPVWIDIVIRYLRLAVPATASALFAWVLLSLMPDATSDLSAFVTSRWHQWTYQGSIPGPGIALYNGLVGIFVGGGSFFNNVLWTMRPEFVGSIACFLICLFPNSRARLVATTVFAAIAILGRRYEYECFALGIYLREAWAAGRLPSVLPVPALLLGLLVGSQSGDAADRLGLDWLPRVLNPEGKGGLLYPLAAALVVYGCMRCAAVRNALSGRVATLLGAISFPLYLIHVPLLCTIGAAIYVANHASPLLYLYLTACAAAMFALAYLAQRYMEKPFLVALGGLRRTLRRLAAARTERSLRSGIVADGKQRSY
jgi:peptidoglycan/LPS O-acetylase OafA/YrhL